MEMRKAWTKPLAVAEQFVANEYVAACGDQNMVYKYKCDAGRHGTLFGYDVYLNGNDGKAGTRDDVNLGHYSPCDKTHEASTKDDFLPGYMRKEFIIGQGEMIPVIVWRGEDGKNVHCTTQLNMDSWETAKS